MSSAPFDLVVAEILDDARRRPRRESIRLVREKYVDVGAPGGVDRRGVLAVEFENGSGEPYHALCGVDRRTDGGWHLRGGTSERITSGRPDDGWVSSGSWSSGSTVSVGLWLARADVHVARIVDPHGQRMEDTVENGVALFIRDGEPLGLRASTVELSDRSGGVLVSAPYQRQKWEKSRFG